MNVRLCVYINVGIREILFSKRDDCGAAATAMATVPRREMGSWMRTDVEELCETYKKIYYIHMWINNIIWRWRYTRLSLSAQLSCSDVMAKTTTRARAIL